MKIIDRTSLQNAQGDVDFFARIQGTLRYGLNWYPELQAQKAVVAQLNRTLEKGFVLIRNFTLPDVELAIPIILIGVSGMWVIYVTPVKGHFEAKGDQWNNIINNRRYPANVNLLNRATRFARAVQVYLGRQGVDLSLPVEPILITADPGAHVETIRPVVRVVMSDAIKNWAASLLQLRPVWGMDYIHFLADRIVNPRPPEPPSPVSAEQSLGELQPAPSRAKAIFEASAQVQPFNPEDLRFALEEKVDVPNAIPAHLRQPSPAQSLPRNVAARKGRFLGMTLMQLVVLAGMIFLECCVLAGFGAYIFFVTR